ncbi:MAG: hypothetical protein NTZ48_06670, partial [Candidatus Omnitrophica bacterium]|nr:hypothetical protein [Candidatus Omnitrophota bacterium]
MCNFAKFFATVISIFLLLNLCPDYSFNDFMYGYFTNRRVKDNDSAIRKQLGIDLTHAVVEGRLSSTPDPAGQNTYNNILEWLKPEYGDSWREIKTLVDSGNWSELRDAFYTTASFGTAGMRGKMGVGTNRINIYAVRRVAQAIADDLRAKFGDPVALTQRPYVICYDTRDGSEEFAQETAAILATNGIDVAIVEGDRPIGWFSHIIPEVNGLGGLMIT